MAVSPAGVDGSHTYVQNLQARFALSGLETLSRLLDQLLESHRGSCPHCLSPLKKRNDAGALSLRRMIRVAVGLTAV
jgi:hypothetical protein